MADFFFFTEPDKLNPQPPGLAYGPIDEDNYRVNNIFSANSTPKAIAVTAGNILLQQVDGPTNSNLVNLVLKPTGQLGSFFPRIDYIIYKGVLKDSLVKADGKVQDRTNNDLTRKVWESYDAMVAEFKPPMEFPEEPTGDDVFGLSISASVTGSDRKESTDAIDSVFYSKEHSLFGVDGGDHIGSFDSTRFGIMVVIEKIGYQVPFSLLREFDSIISVGALPSSPTPRNEFDRKNEKESILSFVEPLSFFTACLSDGLLLSSNKEDALTTSNYYSTIITKHSNAGKIYLDIRNQYGDSYNYYNNYTNIVRLSIDEEDNFNQINYYESNDWPILEITESQFNDSNTSDKFFRLALPNRDNEAPLLYLKRAFVEGETSYELAAGSNQFITPVQLPLGGAVIQDTLIIESDLLVPNHAEHILTNYFQLKYIKRVDVENDDQNDGDFNNPVLGYSLFKRSYLDALFPIFDMHVPFTDNNFTNLKIYEDASYIDKILLKESEQNTIISDYTLRDYTANIGIATTPGTEPEDEIITFIASPFAYNLTFDFNNRILPIVSLETENANPFLIEMNSMYNSFNLVRSTFEENGIEREYLRPLNSLRSDEGTFNLTEYNFSDTIIIGITRAQYQILEGLRNNFIENTKVYLGIKNVNSIIYQGNRYFSFELVLRGLRQNTNGEIVSGVITTGITTYTNEEILGFSSGYVLPMPAPYIEEDYHDARTRRGHNGVDLEAAQSEDTLGQPVFAIIGGTVDRIVKAADLTSQGGNDENLGGVRVRIYNQSTGLYYNYFHMEGGSNDTLNVGDNVQQGAQIGTVGGSGRGNLNEFTPHLHLEIWDRIIRRVNPYLVFPELALLPFISHRNQ